MSRFYDDNYYEDNYDENGLTDLISSIGEEFSEKTIADILSLAGIIPIEKAKYVGNMEKLVFLHGEENEVYSPLEIRFIESVDDVIVFNDFFKQLKQGKMVCRTIAVKMSINAHDAIRSCLAFEKIINKALDGFNIFLFIAEDGAYWGCRVFDRKGHKDCALSIPIINDNQFEQMLYEISDLTDTNSFLDYYSLFYQTITDGQDDGFDYDYLISQRRGIQTSYLEGLSELEQNIGIDMSMEKERYWNMFVDKREESFIALLEEVDDSLSFIKSNRINTYELLFEAEETMKNADATELENNRLLQSSDNEDNLNMNLLSDEDAATLLDDPEEMIKFIKRRKGI